MKKIRKMMCATAMAAVSLNGMAQDAPAAPAAAPAPDKEQYDPPNLAARAGSPASVANEQKTEAPKLDDETVKQRVGYFLGHRMGQQLAEIPTFNLDDVDANSLLQGIKDGLKNKVDDKMKEVEPALDIFRQRMDERYEAKAEANLEAGKKFMEENAKKPGVKTLPSGVQYIVVKPGGDVKYNVEKDGDDPTFKLMYEGRLIDGTVFDKSEKPVEFKLQLIPGFTDALKAMPVGAKWKVFIPSELAYKEAGPGIIGPNSTLIFDIELLEIIPGNSPATPPAGGGQLTPEMLQQLLEAQQQGAAK